MHLLFSPCNVNSQILSFSPKKVFFVILKITFLSKSYLLLLIAFVVDLTWQRSTLSSLFLDPLNLQLLNPSNLLRWIFSSLHSCTVAPSGLLMCVAMNSNLSLFMEMPNKRALPHKEFGLMLNIITLWSLELSSNQKKKRNKTSDWRIVSAVQPYPRQQSLRKN